MNKMDYWKGYAVISGKDEIYFSTFRETAIEAFEMGVNQGLFCGVSQAKKGKFKVVHFQVKKC